MNNPICPYCGSTSELVTGAWLYPHRKDLHHKKFYECIPCDARVGCHPNSTTPLGRLADAELRTAKSAAHAAFDPLWRTKSNFKTRSKAYAWLSWKMGIPPKETHIGMFDLNQCAEVIRICHGLKCNKRK